MNDAKLLRSIRILFDILNRDLTEDIERNRLQRLYETSPEFRAKVDKERAENIARIKAEADKKNDELFGEVDRKLESEEFKAEIIAELIEVESISKIEAETRTNTKAKLFREATKLDFI